MPLFALQHHPIKLFSIARLVRWVIAVLPYGLLFGVVWLAWWFSQQGYFRAGDDVGYWLGVAGASMMLLLFSYPLRKYFRFMHRWGKVKWWFLVHMALGVLGPLLILLHSTFRVGSLNAGVALYSMVVVALSGIVGRFIYVRIHHGLHGNRASLAALQSDAQLEHDQTHSKLSFAPDAEAVLQAFEDDALSESNKWSGWFRPLLVLPWKRFRVERACVHEIRSCLIQLRNNGALNEQQYQALEQEALDLVRHYLQTVVRVAQFAAYERLFAMWHVAHVPFVYSLVISAVIHVLAVHAY